MTPQTRWFSVCARYPQRVDAALMAVSRRTQHVVVAMAVLLCAVVGLHDVPSAYVDFSGWPVLSHIQHRGSYGSDTLSDMYVARVILNDVTDMYTKSRVAQTPQEAATWTRRESGPYPPAALLSMAGLYAIGERTGLGFYGSILGLAVLFVLSSAIYCLMTRWYVFPLMCVNASYLSDRFVAIQDDSYLVMLTVVMAALFLARARHPATHAAMAVAICMKLSPLAYLRHLPAMTRRMAALVIAVVVAGLVLPFFVWDDYLYIYEFHTQRKGNDWLDLAGSLLVVVPFTVVMWTVDRLARFDMEDRVGWGMVPFALLIALTMNAPRHLILVLLVPDKRAARTVAGTAGLALHQAGLIPFGAVTALTTALLFLVLACYMAGSAGTRPDHPQ
jgi:hypothetical protein